MSACNSNTSHYLSISITLEFTVDATIVPIRMVKNRLHKMATVWIEKRAGK